jgi:hypothetical protein
MTWYSPDALNYGIYKSTGSWTAPDYQQLKLQWITGIILNPGTGLTKSYVEVIGDGLRVTKGKVGIGTITPAAILHIATSNDLNPNNIGNTNFDNRHLAIGSTGANASSLAFSKNCTSNGSAYITSATIGLSWDPIGFQASDYNWFSGGSTTPNMILNASGNLGLGIKNPQNKLDVNGTIHSKQVDVDMNGWSDFVFNPSYNLASLSTIKNYLDKNHHLPDMPSEKEVVKDGVNVGNMLKLQTQKIEELTLYLIEKDQQLTDQKKEIEQLKQKQEARMSALEQALSKLTSNSKD